MPKIDVTAEEMTEILNALDMSEKSAKRAQNTGRSPQIKAVYEAQARNVTALKGKLAAAK